MYNFNVQELPIELCAKCHSSLPDPNDLVFDKILEHIHRKPPNDFCHAHELPIFEPLLEEAEDQLSSYDATLGRLQSTLEILQRQRSDLWRLKEQLRGLVKPSIRRLPTEVLLHIFSLCKEPKWGPSQCDASLILSHVCAPWRSIIFSEPSLWTDIVVHFGLRRHHVQFGNHAYFSGGFRHNCAIAEHTLAFTQFCLDKSRARPLYVEFGNPDMWSLSDCPNGLGCPLLVEVCRHSNHWKHTTLRVDARGSLDFADSMPYLEYLRIERYQPEYPQAISRNEMETSLPKISTPRLCELTVKGRVWRDLMRLDTSALTVFSTDTPDVVTILGVLQRSPKLEILNLRYPDSMYFADPRMTTMIQMTTSRIRSLQVELREDSEPSFLFDFLHLPSLTLLKVSGVYEFSWPEASEAIAQSLVNLLRRSQPPLVTLDNQRMNLSSVQLRDIMELCPSITTLCLGSCDFYFHGQLVSTISLPLLTVPVSTPPLLPNLSNLTFYDVGHIDFDELVMMLESRQNWRRPGETEQEQRFKSELTCYNLTEDQQKHLAGLSNERMTVTVNGVSG